MKDELSVYEKLGIFYLGKEVDLKTLETTENLFLYKSKNLTTHAAIIGMTGSGKTGLGIDIIEEAAIDKIPSLIIDPKGDMGNLLLTFPDLKPQDFKPWIDPKEAESKGLSVEEYARKTAETWEKGIESYHQNKERIKRLKENADFNIYTPGSNAGVPLSVLSGFEAPSKETLNDPDAFSTVLNSAVSSLLALVGVEGNPLESREYMLLASIFAYFWKKETSLTLEEIIGYVANPPFDKIGVLPLKSFYPQNERLKLAMLLNNILANPAFSVWLEGEKLEIKNLLYTEEGKPKVSIISIAHLNDKERMFFVTLLLNKYIEWMRKQSGTGSLRTILYMDEIFGFFPSTSNPPSKEPMLLLLKQARAYGVGVVLATQNPIDLDYKGLSNIGSWFIGRLQTKQDKERVLDGLLSGKKESLNKKEIENLISSLKPRTFLFKSAKEDEPKLFKTRWVLSYLRGPVTKEEIKRLTKNKKTDLYEKEKKRNFHEESSKDILKAPPILPEDIDVFYLNSAPFKENPVYEPFMIFEGSVRFYNQKRGIDIKKHLKYELYLDENMKDIEFDLLKESGENKSECEEKPLKNASFHPLASFVTKKRKRVIEKEFKDFLYHNQKLTLYRCKELKLESEPFQSASEFRIKVNEVLKEKYENELEKLKKKFEKKEERLRKKLQRALNKLEKEEADVSAKTTDTILSFGMTLLDAFFGRKTIKKSTAAKAAGSLRSAGRVLKEKEDVKRAQEEVNEIREELNELKYALEDEIEKLSEKFDPENYTVEEFFIKPRRSDIFDTDLFLCWKEI